MYAAVGHAGASGYIAVMTLWGFLPEEIKPTALCLNIVVALIASYRYYRAGHFSFRLFWPFAVTSIPLAFLGGYVEIDGRILKWILGFALLIAAAGILWRRKEVNVLADPPAMTKQLGIGAALGFVSGLTGVGGGIFLSPLLIYLRWSSLKTTAAVSALFILVNSAAGLAGHLGSLQHVPEGIAWWIPAVVAGGAIGAWQGSTKLSSLYIRIALMIVLVIAGAKMLFG